MVFSSSLQILCILLCNYSTTTYCFVSNWLMRFSLLAYSQYVFVHHLDRILFRLVPHNEILRLYLYIKWNHLSVVFFCCFTMSARFLQYIWNFHHLIHVLFIEGYN